MLQENSSYQELHCSEIRGIQSSSDKDLQSSQIFYPCMQCGDIFNLKVDICQLGSDQNKANLLAIEYANIVTLRKPVFLSHHILMGLTQGTKMSKSDDANSIYMHLTEAEVNAKIKNTCWCPPNIVDGNPCFDYLKHLIFVKFDSFTISRNEKNGGNKTYTNYEDVVSEYEQGILHPGDLKPAISKSINELLSPIRNHFATDPKAKELIKKLKTIKK